MVLDVTGMGAIAVPIVVPVALTVMVNLWVVALMERKFVVVATGYIPVIMGVGLVVERSATCVVLQ